MELIGSIERVIFNNPENNYAVIEIAIDKKRNEKVIIVGNFYIPKRFELIRFVGDFIESKYGRQFKVSNVQKLLPTDKNIIVKFLASPIFEGIGKTCAEKIVNALGDDALTQIVNNPSCLEETGIKKKQADIIIASLNAYLYTNETLDLLTNHGLSMGIILKLFAVYQDNLISVLKNNPYILIDNIEGISFKIVDKIAMAFAIETNYLNRLRALLLYITKSLSYRLMQSFVNIENLFAEISKEAELDEQTFASLLNNLENDKKIVVEGSRVYIYEYYEAEVFIALRMNSINQTPIKEIDKIDKIIQDVASEENIIYDTEQINAIKQSVENNICIITGGPGVGKTTILNALVKVFSKIYPSAIISLCAPTGRAARRISDVTRVSATTIHSLLKWDLETNDFSFNENNPINTDIIIIDELSMVHLTLFYRLLLAGTNIRKIILIGDHEQLPPILPGDILKDLINTKKIPTVFLNKVFRQAQTSNIIPLANNIKDGILEESLFNANGVFVKKVAPDKIGEVIINTISLLKGNGLSLEDIQILCPKYDGINGIYYLNELIQKEFNPKDPDKKEISINKYIYRVGDRILQLKNQYDDNINNGDIGKLLDIETDPKLVLSVDFDGNIVRITNEKLDNIALAYAISVHKSQGSEYKAVIFPVLSKDSFMLKRNLIYTALTRAKESLYIFGDLEVLKKGVRIKDVYHLKSTLSQRFNNL